MLLRLSVLFTRAGDINVVILGDLYQYLALQDVLCMLLSVSGTGYVTILTAFLVLLTGFIRLVVLPSYCLIALLADDVPDNVSPSCHVSFHCFTLSDVDDIREEKGLSMLTSKVTRNDLVKVG